MVGITAILLLALLGAASLELPGTRVAADTPPTPTPEVKPIAEASETAAPAKTKRAWSTKSAVTRDSETPSFAKVFGTIAFLGVMLVFGVLCAKRLMAKSRMLPGGSRVLNLVDAIPLGPKRQIYVVTAYDRKLVIGSSGDRLTLLSEFTGEEVGAHAAAGAFAAAVDSAVVEPAHAGERR